MVRMTATDVSRNFSSVLNRVNAGEEIEIVRNGSPIAELRRSSRPRGLSGAAFKALMERLPALDEDFARDVEESRRALGPPVNKWPSS
jgi:antitoxin (DNA-binding transcriptional repressor) of toxin-antitoxin stability system